MLLTLKEQEKTVSLLADLRRVAAERRTVRLDAKKFIESLSVECAQLITSKDPSFLRKMRGYFHQDITMYRLCKILTLLQETANGISTNTNPD